jgi:hypothetical protein
MKKSFRSFLPFYILLAITSFVYLPVFLTEYGVHNDYTLVHYDHPPQGPYWESRMLVEMGRPLQALLLTGLERITPSIRTLALWRVGGFIIMMAVVGMFVLFLQQRCRVEPFWAFLIVLGTITLPATQVFILWFIQTLSGSWPLFLALVSYWLLDPIGQTNNGQLTFSRWQTSLRMIGAALFFLGAIFTYPLSALFVFVCTFAEVSLAPFQEESQRWRILIRDIFFYGFLMACYFLVSQRILIPYAQTHFDFMRSNQLPFAGENDTYTFALGVPVIKKLELILKIIKISWTGIWFLPWGFKGGWIAVGLIGVSLLVMRIQSLRERSRIIAAIRWWWASLILFLLINAPSILAKGVEQIHGYHLIFCASVFFIIFQYGLMQQADRSASFPWERKGLRLLAIVVSMIQVILCANNTSQSVQRFRHELSFVRDKVTQMDLGSLKAVKVLMLGPWPQGDVRGKTAVEVNRFIEFRAIFCRGIGVRPIVAEIAQRRGVAIPEVQASKHRVNFFDPYTAIIDMNEAWPQEHPLSRLNIRVFIPPPQGQIVRIEQQEDAFLTWTEQKGGRQPFVISGSEKGQSVIELEFIDRPALLPWISLGLAVTQNFRKIPIPFEIKASNEGRDWIEMPYEEVQLNQRYPSIKTFLFKNPAVYRKYRFVIMASPPGFVPVAAVIFLLPPSLFAV